MIHLKLNHFSKMLATHTDVEVLIPNMADNEAYLCSDLNEVYGHREYPVLYLLHGALEDHSSWIRRTNIESYAEEAGVMVVMPSAHNSFYTDALLGDRYYSYIARELPLFIESFLPVKKGRENTFIAGPSMGGYGAVVLALKEPGRFGAFACLSGAVDPGKLEPMMKDMGFDFFRYDLIFGGSDKVKGSTADPFALAKQVKGDKPEAYIYCGEQDSANYVMNSELYAELLGNGFNAEFKGSEGGHDWKYWDGAIADFLKKIAK